MRRSFFIGVSRNLGILHRSIFIFHTVYLLSGTGSKKPVPLKTRPPCRSGIGKGGFINKQIGRRFGMFAGVAEEDTT